MKQFKRIAEEEMDSFQEFIESLTYPITREEVIAQADSAELEEYIVELLSELEEGEYNDAEELSEAIGELDE
ncbi:MAG: DUF2795 domain-containing protein [Candidatus Dojkabacteria bacterium]|nr:DUF2795 domain-containing protein [Candidatus Dojkabacteria bacterium]